MAVNASDALRKLTSGQTLTPEEKAVLGLGGTTPVVPTPVVPTPVVPTPVVSTPESTPTSTITTKLEDLPANVRRVIEANAGNELIPVKRDANGVITEYRQMSPQEYLTSKGGITRAGYFGNDIGMSDEEYFSLLKQGGVELLNETMNARVREGENQKLLARYKAQGMSDAQAQEELNKFYQEAAEAEKRGYYIDENGNQIPFYGAGGGWGGPTTTRPTVSSNIPAGLDAQTTALIKSLQNQINSLTKQVGTSTATATADKYNERMSVYATMADRFNKYGLTGLANKIKELAMQGATEATITLELMETPEYQQRFAANADRLKSGLKALTPAEYVNVEDSYRQVLRAYGLRQFDNDAYVRQFIANDMSPTELSNRVVTAVQRVQNADPAVVNQLKQYYGIGAPDMVAYVLDPQQQFQKIERQIAASEIGVAAGRQGLTAGVSVAEQLAAQGVSQAEAQKGYATIADILPTAEKLSDIYGTTLEEYGQAEGEQEVFNQLASAQRKRQRLTQREIAAFSGSSGTNKTSLTTSAVGQF
jgi:hypothetical protein